VAMPCGTCIMGDKDMVFLSPSCYLEKALHISSIMHYLLLLSSIFNEKQLNFSRKLYC
jgi:hypothetical protein